MENSELLIKIREDRPNQVIHSVLGFKESAFGILDVSVDMEIEVMGIKINHYHISLPYTLEKYNNLLNIK